VWRKHRLDEGTAPDEPSAQLGGRRATGHLSPMGDDGTHTNTKQLLQPGPWHERLPHVATSHVLAPAGELHTEYFVRRSEARSALEAVAALSPVLAPVIRTSEIRTIAGDDAWLSPFRGDTVGLHFSWHIDAIGLPAVMVALEEALDPFEPVPHWGKLYTMEPSTIRARHPRFADFVDLAERLDPEHRFRNPHLDALIG
jgi:xylitol oxidase